ncbi:hypothetical protein OS493_000756 [Desmophyllum pertusum]|uniref:Uncharacterized protein n=1 Tax=Desmophyllum pertusum TaxID=174260 RepID=A0A9X0DEE1_9CNID|nr:hypothetical protein OS493_000756 [Desmophyllum pertusum]
MKKGTPMQQTTKPTGQTAALQPTDKTTGQTATQSPSATGQIATQATHETTGQAETQTSYVQELKGELFSVTSKSQLKSVSDKYNAKVPPPLTSQFTERVNKPEAVKSYKEREKREVTHLYPSAEEQDHLQSSTTTSEAPVRRQRKQAKCRKCGKPMKGHSASVCNTDNSTN